MFTTIGSAADHGNFGRWLLFVITLICWGVQFANMTLTSVHISLATLTNLHTFHEQVPLGGPSPWLCTC